MIETANKEYSGYPRISSINFINQNQEEMNAKIIVGSKHLSLLQALEEELKGMGLKCNALVKNKEDGISISEKSFTRVESGKDAIITHTLPQDWQRVIDDVRQLVDKRVIFTFGGRECYEEKGIINMGDVSFEMKEVIPLYKLLNLSIRGYSIELPNDNTIKFGCKSGTVEELKTALALLAEKYPKEFTL